MAIKDKKEAGVVALQPAGHRVGSSLVREFYNRPMPPAATRLARSYNFGKTRGLLSLPLPPALCFFRYTLGYRPWGEYSLRGAGNRQRCWFADS